MFKQALYSFKLNLNLEEINNFCLDFELKNNSRFISNSGGFQSGDLDFNIPIVNKILCSILDNVNFVSQEHFKLKKLLSISNIWFNINRHKDHNLTHIHPNSLLSGVFYSKAPNNSGGLKFFTSETARIFITSFNVTENNNYNSSSYKLEPEASFLHIFPSFLNHCVEPNLSNQERISFSFNTATL
jgi:uncharacterized protein (TIGR02466 family)